MLTILTEEETLKRMFRVSIARYGDGELRVATGGTCYGHREAIPKAAAELRAILHDLTPGLMVGIPRYGFGPNATNWARYEQSRFTRLYNDRAIYGSAFVTRPDSAPQIDTEEYWATVRKLWEGKNVTLVIGSSKSLDAGMLAGAGDCRVIEGPVDGAYKCIDELEERIGKPSGPVLMCLGVTATILAARLAKKNVHALDLGHIGMFMKRFDRIKNVDLTNLISDEYRKANMALHNGKGGFGGSGWKHADRILEILKETKVKEVLDYGCGEGTLKATLKDRIKQHIWEFDPAINAKARLPKAAGLVVCTDVLEHVEPEKLDAVLDHLAGLTLQRAYLVIATRPANKLMPDGSNAHKIIEKPSWWTERIAKFDWKIDKVEEIAKGGKDHEVRVWLSK